MSYTNKTISNFFSFTNHNDDYTDYDPNYYEEEIGIEELNYDGKTNVLTFKVIKTTRKPKITRYVQQNYIRTPIYGELSERQKIIKQYNKAIWIEKFLEEEIININEISDEIKEKICGYLVNFLDHEFIPSWLQKIYDIRKIENKILALNIEINGQKEEVNKTKDELTLTNISLEEARKMPTVSNSKGYLISAIILIPILIGLIMLFFYTNERTAQFNRDEISRLENEQQKEIKKLEKLENDLTHVVNSNSKKIALLENELDKIEQTTYERKFSKNTDGYLDLRNEIKFSHRDVIKGVYLIWNKTKDKYYVGQSKDINKRVFSQHFSVDGPKNHLFFKDWNDNDEFLVKIIPCSTKDELDKLEKEYIEKYDSFKNGYNNTGGNK